MLTAKIIALSVSAAGLAMIVYSYIYDNRPKKEKKDSQRTQAYNIWWCGLVMLALGLCVLMFCLTSQP